MNMIHDQSNQEDSYFFAPHYPQLLSGPPLIKSFDMPMSRRISSFTLSPDTYVQKPLQSEVQKVIPVSRFLKHFFFLVYST